MQDTLRSGASSLLEEQRSPRGRESNAAAKSVGRQVRVSHRFVAAPALAVQERLPARVPQDPGNVHGDYSTRSVCGVRTSLPAHVVSQLGEEL